VERLKKALVVITIFTIMLIATSAMAGEMGKSLMKDKAALTSGSILVGRCSGFESAGQHEYVHLFDSCNPRYSQLSWE